MPLNPYAELAKIAGILGPNDATKVLGAGAKAQRDVEQNARQVQSEIKRVTGFGSHATRGAIAGRNSNSLPGIRVPGMGVVGQGLKVKGTFDAQGIQITPPRIGSRLIPKVNMVGMDDGSVKSTLTAYSVYVAFISPVDWRRLQRLAMKMFKKAEQLSKGRLSYADLRRKNHPYGWALLPPSAMKDPKTGKPHKSLRRRGLGRLTSMRGVSNMAVVNIHTGDFYNAWEPVAEKGKLSVSLGIINHSEVARWLAFGTGSEKRKMGMRAHGPFLTAVQLFLPEFTQLWKEVTDRAYLAYAKSRRNK